MKARRRRSEDNGAGRKGLTGRGRPFSQNGAAWFKGCSVQAVKGAIGRGELPHERQVGVGGETKSVVIYEDDLNQWTPRRPGAPRKAEAAS